MNSSLWFSVGFSHSFFSLYNVVCPFSNVISTRSKDSLSNVFFTRSNFLFSRFFKIGHENSWVSRIRSFLKSAHSHCIGIISDKINNAKLQLFLSMEVSA